LHQMFVFPRIDTATPPQRPRNDASNGSIAGSGTQS
jgi:hypothetical protein